MTDTVRDFFVDGHKFHGTPDEIADLLELFYGIKDRVIGVVPADAPKKKSDE